MRQHLTIGRTAQRATGHQRILVGFDGSPGSSAAVDWAAREAATRHSLLQVLMGRAIPETVDFYGIGSVQSNRLYDIGARILSSHPDLEVVLESTVVDPRDALLEAARHADLMVVGAHESGMARRVLLGSVAHTAARRSPCPLVVVRGGSTAAPVHRIVVGVDGSSAADAALHWAGREADLHAAELVVVHGWERRGARGGAQELLDRAIETCRRYTNRPITGQLFDGDGTTALVAASFEADLVAIGSRGCSGFRTALFGSVALGVAEDAGCPVAVTHPRARAE